MAKVHKTKLLKKGIETTVNSVTLNHASGLYRPYQHLVSVLGTRLGHNMKENVCDCDVCAFQEIKAFFLFDFISVTHPWPHVNLLFLWRLVRLCDTAWRPCCQRVKSTHPNDLDPKTIYRAELPYIAAQVAVSSFTHLCCCDLKATQVNVAVSQAEFGLCNVVFCSGTHPGTRKPT